MVEFMQLSEKEWPLSGWNGHKLRQELTNRQTFSLVLKQSSENHCIRLYNMILHVSTISIFIISYTVILVTLQIPGIVLKCYKQQNLVSKEDVKMHFCHFRVGEIKQPI